MRESVLTVNSDAFAYLMRYLGLVSAFEKRSASHSLADSRPAASGRLVSDYGQTSNKGCFHSASARLKVYITSTDIWSAAHRPRPCSQPCGGHWQHKLCAPSSARSALFELPLRSVHCGDLHRSLSV